ncbi:VOC family protein [Actinomycetospora aeridis]|uniref:VOC family protein n=1 Tax=Actinomycetospora aeridis TaxID=3129231 RepID=A0ABU8NAD7_9PSEU
MGQPVAYFEITSTAPEKIRAFYTELFGWTAAADPSMEGYAMVDTGAGPDAISGGIGPSQAPGDTGVKIYVRVDDLEKELARAGQLGADTLALPMDLPEGYGRIAVVADPDGNPVGLWA